MYIYIYIYIYYTYTYIIGNITMGGGSCPSSWSRSSAPRAHSACRSTLHIFDRYSAGLLPRGARSLCHRLLGSISRSGCLSM